MSGTAPAPSDEAIEAAILAASNPVHDDGHTDTYYAGLLAAAYAIDMPRIMERLVPLAEVVEWLEAEARRLAVEGAEQTYQDDAYAELARCIADRFGGGER